MRLIVNVATDTWVKGQNRLKLDVHRAGEKAVWWTDKLPLGSPPHRDRGTTRGPAHSCVPYAFKAYALKEAAHHANTLLWCDSSIVLGERPLADLWEKIERDGYWIMRNGWSNYEWTADAAYKDLFPTYPGDAVWMNKQIPHVVGTAFGISLAHETGRAILAEYFRLASSTRAFCGPWQNSNAPSVAGRNSDRTSGPCGPPDVLGHRHDQTALSVIAWRLGCVLSECPEWFNYDTGTDKTCLIAKGI
jgi:hypothetical protein